MAQNPSLATHRWGRTAFEVSRVVLALLAALTLSACAVGESFTRGQKISADQLEQVPIGSSREQAVLALGTPTTTGLVDGEALYYISQTSARTFAFQKTAVRDRRILVVYLGDDSEVRQIAEYGLKDGKVFDYLSRKTRTSGRDLAFLSQVLTGIANPTL
ncbi:outer membrane protein assembly factor BamE [Acuticoccus sp.]|uniref:outer membrane protein assembly factor BamE n=1 Tax=Acuticoccus sp. TaxID=1904378 RepID=UPI003B524A53